MPDKSATPFDEGLFLVHLNRAKEHFQQRNFTEAEAELEQARRMRPTNEAVLNLLGLTFFKQEKYRDADSIYRQLIEFNPGSEILHFNQGLICFKLGSLDRAEAAFLRALELTPENQKASFYLGNIYEKKKQYYNAIFQYRKAGANIMVKRVQAKVSGKAGAEPVPEPAPPQEEKARPTEKTLPPSARQQPTTEGDDTSPGLDLRVTVDHIDKQRFLSALSESPFSEADKPAKVRSLKPPPSPQAAVPEEPSQKPPSPPPPPVRDEPRSPPPAQPAVVELAEPVIPDMSLSEMAQGKVLSDATASLFTSPPSAEAPPAHPEDDLGFATAGRVETVQPKSIPPDRHLSLEVSDETQPTHHYSKLRRRDDIFRYLENNLMEVNFSGKVFIKQGTIYSYSGNLTFWVKPQRDEAASPLVIVSGTGKLLLSDRQREISVMQINGEEVFVEPSHLLACQETLTPRYALIKKEGQSESQLQVLAIEGTGMIALSVATSPLLLTVTPGFPVNVSSANIISWSGKLTPSIIDDEALSELMFPHSPRALNLRLEGTGKVMMEKLLP
jgi:uncharacterized protein (AIM24 family)